MVMETLDTAAPEAAVTADPATEAPPSVETPESAEVESPETGQIDAPETEAPKNPLDDLDEDSLLEHPKVKDILARREESARRKAEHEASTRKAASDIDWAKKQGFVNDFADILRGSITQGEDGPQLRLDPKRIDEVTGRLWETNVLGTIGAVSQVVHNRLGDDYRFTPEDNKRLSEGYAEFTSNPSGKAMDYLSTLLDVVGKAAVEAATPQLRKDIEKAVRKDFETKAEADSRQRAETAARNGGSPTNLTGDGPTHRSDAQLIEIYGSGGSITDSELERLKTLI